MRVLVHLAQQLEVLAIAVVVVAGDERGVAVGDLARLLLPFPPVAVLVVALDLVGGAGRAPEKPAREAAHADAAVSFDEYLAWVVVDFSGGEDS